MTIFKDLVEAALAKLGAQRNDAEASSYAYSLPTMVGGLLCHVTDDSMLARFQNVERACGVVQSGSLNPNSGKWNWHFTNAGEQEARNLFVEMAGLLPALPRYGDFPDDGGRASTKPISARVSYMYRDGGNNRVGGAVVFRPEMAPRHFIEQALIRACFIEDGVAFIVPGQVGLKDLQASFLGCAHVWEPELDHAMHEITGIDWTSVATPSDGRSFSEFVSECIDVALGEGGWNEAYKPPFYAEMKAEYDARQMRESMPA